jgi:hypothetical protein
MQGVFHNDPCFEDRHSKGYLAWDEAPPQGAKIASIWLNPAQNTTAFPRSIASIQGLERLRVEAPMARMMRPEDLPSSLFEIVVVSSESGSFLKDVVFPHIRTLAANHLRFETHQFPNITNLSYNIVPKDLRTQRLIELKFLQALGVGNVKPPDLQQIAALPNIESLAFGGPSLETIEVLRSHPTLRSISITGCPKLTSLSCLATIASLQEVEIGYCNALTDLTPILYLRQLRSVRVYGCKSLDGVDVARELRARGVKIDVPPPPKQKVGK